MSILSSLGLRRRGAPRNATTTTRWAQRLQVERLECRTVPASYNAATVPELIAAINAANQTPEADTIVLSSQATYTLTQVNNNADGFNGLPVVGATEDLTILGNGSVLQRSTATGVPFFRLFDVAAGGTLRLESLTLQGGLERSGGAVYSRGDLVLDHVNVQKCQAVGIDGLDAAFDRGGGSRAQPGGDGRGGGLFIDGGTALLSGVTIASNTARGGAGGDGYSSHGNADGGESGAQGGNGLGGGMYIAAGEVSLRNCVVTNNVAKGGTAGKLGGAAGQGVGGGLYIVSPLVILDLYSVSHVNRNKASTSNADIYGTYLLG
jgi:hypothetical protein